MSVCALLIVRTAPIPMAGTARECLQYLGKKSPSTQEGTSIKEDPQEIYVLIVAFFVILRFLASHVYINLF
jgi:hypothetical protein